VREVIFSESEEKKDSIDISIVNKKG